MYWKYTSIPRRLKLLFITLISNTPITVLSTEPEPPATDVPPITTDAIASISYPSPAIAVAVPSLPVSTIPAIPASTALIINTFTL